MWNSIKAVAVKVVRTLTGRDVQQSSIADGGGTISQSPHISGDNNQVTYGTSMPAVPVDWWDRPGAPEFVWAGSYSAGQRPRLDPRVRKTGGGDIGQLRMSMVGGDVELEPQSPIRHGTQFCLPETSFPDPGGGPVVLTLSFWWDGADRSLQWKIPFEAHPAGMAPNPPYRPTGYS